MGQLSLLIADVDEGYSKGIANYICSRDPINFQVKYFTNSNALNSFLQQNRVVDVVLVCLELYDEVKSKVESKLTIILSQGVAPKEYSSCEIINKYQTGEKLINNILYLYSKANSEEIHISNRRKDTRIVGVYSPAGGSGKTTIAASLAIQCADRGMTVFYLNLEHIQSTNTYFDFCNEQSLSYALYYVKEKNKNLGFKLNSLKSTDPCTGVHYFCPPQNVLELDEISIDEYETLINELKSSGNYDAIFIDMSSSFDNKTVSMFKLCDRVVVTSTGDPPAKQRFDILLDNLERLNQAREWGLTDKTIYVLNKYNSDIHESDISSGNTITFRCKLPQFTSYTIQQGSRIIINDFAFQKAIDELISILIDGE